MARVILAKLISFVLQPQIHKNYYGAHIEGMHRVMLKYPHEQNWYAPGILPFQTGMDATLLNYMCLDVCELLQSLQWCSNEGCYSQSLSSGIPVGDSFK